MGARLLAAVFFILALLPAAGCVVVLAREVIPDLRHGAEKVVFYVVGPFEVTPLQLGITVVAITLCLALAFTWMGLRLLNSKD